MEECIAIHPDTSTDDRRGFLVRKLPGLPVDERTSLGGGNPRFVEGPVLEPACPELAEESKRWLFDKLKNRPLPDSPNQRTVDFGVSLYGFGFV